VNEDYPFSLLMEGTGVVMDI